MKKKKSLPPDWQFFPTWPTGNDFLLKDGPSAPVSETFSCFAPRYKLSPTSGKQTRRTRPRTTPVRDGLRYNTSTPGSRSVQIGLFFFLLYVYQLLRVQHSCSSTQSWGSVLPSIVETRDQNSRGCPLLFSNRNLGSFCA